MAKSIRRNQSIRTEAEYLSSNNHRPFHESKGAIGLNLCQNGAYCHPKSQASVAASTKPPQMNDKTLNNDKSKPLILPKKPANRVSLAGQKRHEQQRKGRYQVHLKKEDGDLNETIEYNIEYPNRVAVRMEYLTTSTKVRLNDRHFMDGLYEKLMAEEAKAIDKSTELRQSVEKNRVKKLVIEGLMPPPPDMLHLYNHPVFRVNTMLRRLDQHDKGMFKGVKIAGHITPVEPYEYDGDAFFKHLHEHGTYWVPSSERIDEEEKLAGKIARAKLRLMEKRRKEAHHDKMLRLLYNSELADTEEVFDDDENEPKPDDTPEIIDQKRKRRITKLKARLNEEEDNHVAIFKKKKLVLERKEKQRRERASVRQNERDLAFFKDQEKERDRIIENHKQRMTNKSATALKKTKSKLDQPATAISSRVPLFDYRGIFAQPETPPTLKEDESFKDLRSAFRIKGGNTLDKFSPNENVTITRYMDVIKNAEDLFTVGNQLTDLYSREQEKADDFTIQLSRLL